MIRKVHYGAYLDKATEINLVRVLDTHVLMLGNTPAVLYRTLDMPDAPKRVMERSAFLRQYRWAGHVTTTLTTRECLTPTKHPPK